MSTKTTETQSDASIPHSEAMSRLSTDEKSALEKADQAEHSSGSRRERLQKEAEKKAE